MFVIFFVFAATSVNINFSVAKGMYHSLGPTHCQQVPAETTAGSAKLHFTASIRRIVN